MAIVQISKIQHRTGSNVDLPQLDEGELGFSTDEQKLFIGNDPILFPVPDGQITTQLEILTEVSSLDFAKITGTSNTEIQLTSPKLGQLLVADGSSSTMVANTWVNWTGDLLGNGVYHSNNKLHLGNVANIEITGGMDGGVLSTDGAGNLYWTTVSGGGGGSSLPSQTNNSGKYLKTNGSVATWENVFSDTHFATTVRSNISVTDNGGDGGLSYSSSTGVITYTGPSATEARAHFSAGTGVTYDSANGQFSIAQDVSTTATPTFDTLSLNSITVNGLYQDDGQSPTPTVLNGIVFNNSSNTLATSSEFYYQSHTLHVGSIKADGGMIEAGTLFKAPITTKAPNDPGTAGEICWDTNYLYVCTFQDSWEKIELGSTVSGGGGSFSGSYTDLTDKPTIPTIGNIVFNGENIVTDNTTNDIAINPANSWDNGNSAYIVIPNHTNGVTNEPLKIVNKYAANNAANAAVTIGYDNTSNLVTVYGDGSLSSTGDIDAVGNITAVGNVVGSNINLNWNAGANTYRLFANATGLFVEDTSDNTFYAIGLTPVV